MGSMDELRSPSLPTSPAAPVIVFPSPSMLSVLQLLGTIRCPDIARAYGWVHRAAHILNNRGEEDASLVRRRFDGLVAALHRHRGKAGTLADAIGHFRTVARSYKPGLFPCYAVPDLPRTNNDLEHLVGAQRYHERRASGRKAASPATVLRGEVRLIAATATRLRPPPCASWVGSAASNGPNSASVSTAGGRPGPCAPASAATRMLTWPPWNSKRASQLCRSRKKAAAAQRKNIARSLMSLFKRGLRRIRFCLQRLIAPPPLWAAWKTDGW